MKEMNSHMAEYPIDLTPLLEDCLGQVDMLEDLLLIYKSNVAEFFEDMDQHLATSNREGIAFATHKVKCGLNMLRTQNLVEIAVKMHDRSKTGADMAEISHLYREFLNEYPLVAGDLEIALTKLKNRL